MMTHARNQKGVSLIAAIFIIVVLAFMGTMFVSMIGTGSLTAVNDLQSAQALSLAEGGLQYALMTGGTCSYNYPGLALGSGTFTTISLLSSAVVDTMDAVTAVVPLPAAPPGSFVIPGVITIDAEHLSCTAVVGNSFTGCARGWAASTAAAHNAGAAATQCVITSTGVVGPASRTVQATVGP